MCSHARCGGRVCGRHHEDGAYRLQPSMAPTHVRVSETHVVQLLCCYAHTASSTHSRGAIFPVPCLQLLTHPFALLCSYPSPPPTPLVGPHSARPHVCSLRQGDPRGHLCAAAPSQFQGQLRHHAVCARRHREECGRRAGQGHHHRHALRSGAAPDRARTWWVGGGVGGVGWEGRSGQGRRQYGCGLGRAVGIMHVGMAWLCGWWVVASVRSSRVAASAV